MHNRHRAISLWVGMVLLAAAFSLLQACTGHAARRMDSAPPVAASGTGDCCEAGSGHDCPGSASMEDAASCVRHCAQLRRTAQQDSALPAPLVTARLGALPARDFVFPTQLRRIGAAPPALSSTPLIYHLKRLRN